MKSHTTFTIRGLVAIAALALSLSLGGCGSTKADFGDAGADGGGANSDGGVVQVSPRESQSIAAAAGRVSRGSLVFDVEVGYSASRAPTSNTTQQWQSGSPVIP